LGVVAGLALPGTAGADSGFESGWQLRFYFAAINFDDPAGGSEQFCGSGHFCGDSRYTVDIGAGLGVNAEYRFSRTLGVDLGVLAGGGVDVEARTVRVGNATWVTHDTLSYTPLTLGLNVHLTPESAVDLYLGPVIGLIQYGGLTVQTGRAGVTTQIGLDEDFAVGAALGLGIPLGERPWSFNAHLMYLDSTLNGGSRQGAYIDSDYDATIFGLGFGYRF
jgi:outer membrane protein W